MNWLPGFLEQCRRERLCMAIGCTTCGSGEFRKALWKRASMAGGASGLELGRPDQCRWGLIDGLRELRSSDRLRLDRAELWSLLDHAIQIIGDLDIELEGTPAGEVLADLRRASIAAARRRERRRRDQQTRARASRTRRRRGVWERRVRHESRLEIKQTRDVGFAEAVRRFEMLEPIGRLRWLAREISEVPIDRLPEELLPIGVDPLALLEVERCRLINRIGGRRRRWRLLRMTLESE